MQRYGRGGLAYEKLSEAGTMIEARLMPAQISSRGTKYSCVELVDQAPAVVPDHHEHVQQPESGGDGNKEVPSQQPPLSASDGRTNPSGPTA
jgi:hypothetical protein